MKKCGLILLVLLSFSFLTGCITGAIKGQVLDTEDRPVEGAIVTTDPPTQSIRTTEAGYEITDVPVNEYTVRARKPGFKSGEAKVRVQWNTTTGADIQIERDN